MQALFNAYNPKSMSKPIKEWALQLGPERGKLEHQVLDHWCEWFQPLFWHEKYKCKLECSSAWWTAASSNFTYLLRVLLSTHEMETVVIAANSVSRRGRCTKT